jgi:hypothetical protein
MPVIWLILIVLAIAVVGTYSDVVELWRAQGASR